MSILLPNLALSGYRSFGRYPQYFDQFAKINIFIGRNNSGKSNVLRAIDEVLRQVNGRGPLKLAPKAAHLPDQPHFSFGIGEAFTKEADRYALPPKSPRRDSLPIDQRGRRAEAIMAELLARQALQEGTTLAWSLTRLPERKAATASWLTALSAMQGPDVQFLWSFLTNQRDGDRKQHWEPEIAARFPLKLAQQSVELIPAIRRIGESGFDPVGYDGTGIINRLAQLQNPSAEQQVEKLRFEAINEFLREVSDSPDARIEIPYARDTILVHMDNKVLPISSLGSGLHEVIILAAAATTLSDQIVCIEEPELHLNPILQKKFIRHLATRTNNQYFITTHSAAIMDTAQAEVYHVRLIDGASQVERVTSDAKRAAVCEDLGYHPSDLLLANSLIWVEGPSDRIYLNWWLRSLDAELVEGIHYSIMFYGGKLAAHLSQAESLSTADDFIRLRHLNQRGVIVIDSDRASPRGPLNATKRRLRDEFDLGPGFAWITAGREVENYLSTSDVDRAVSATIPSATRIGGDGVFDNLLKIRRLSGSEDQASKVEVAKWIVANSEPNLDVQDLRKRMSDLVRFIKDSNPVTKLAS